jgi:O-antigen/teichoic acid export membrane protein
MAALAIAMSTTVALAGDPLVARVFGRVYVIEDSFFAILAAVIVMKFAKITLNFAGVAMGKTKDVMLSNIPNACGLAVTIVSLIYYPHLSAAAGGALVGETLGALAALLLLRRHLGAERLRSWLPIFAVIPVPIVAAAWCCVTSPPVNSRVLALGLAGLCVAVSLALMPRTNGFQLARSPDSKLC